jgi:hypothetical protein
MPIVSAPLRLTPEFSFLFRAVSCLPAGLLGLGPLGGGGGGRGSARLPGGGLGLGPVASGGSREGSRSSSSLPVTSASGEAGLDGDRALLIDTGELLLLDLLLSLGLRVAVYKTVSFDCPTDRSQGKGNIQKYRSGMTSQAVSRL